MIRTIADLLESLKAQEEARLKEFHKVKHPTIIGSMYEGLTQSLLSRTIPPSLDLRYVSGKIINDEGKLSGQIDCMLVSGEGTSIPYTKDFIYNINKVLAIIEIKANLFSRDLEDSHALFKTVREIFQPAPVKGDVVRNAFRNITKVNLEKLDDHKKLPLELQFIYHTVLVQQLLPIRITLGYYGFASENSLRKAFVGYLGDNPGKKGFGPGSLPDLICCRSNSIIKMTGLPYSAHIMEDFTWMVFASYGVNPILLMLELIFTRISHLFDVEEELFGEDMQEEVFNPLLFCRYKDFGDRKGWEYFPVELEDEDLKKRNPTRDWQPWEVSQTECVVLLLMGRRGPISLDDKELAEFLKSEGKTVGEVVASLTEKNLIFVDTDKNLQFLMDECLTVTLPDGRFFAGDNGGRRLERWVADQTEKRKESKS